ncbi:type IV secretory system conjugative DNA transfer family protein [Arsenophonus endosymbiont of Bemisia tabaci]|uniref:type IV secretory system conjugative DNA transfer family protein n=1 Tax=Arsenophonus endosymbiont of Bemisia tabaci TaxID=536059 RepID=UPI0015F4FF9D|nr:type IV secretory system conjugative DNA transfer family protein [Arsenophonus endosymbiont of Bemisia tabaci]
MKNIKNVVVMKTDFVSMCKAIHSGKGAGIIIPNLLDFKNSMLVFDPKLEHQKSQQAF